MIAYAAAADVARSFVDKINEVILFPLIILLSAVALLVFLWGGFQFVYNAADSGAREEGRRHLMWGVIGLLVMVAAYGILTIAANTIGVDVDRAAEGDLGGDIGSYTPTGATRPNPTSPTTPTPTTRTFLDYRSDVISELRTSGMTDAEAQAAWQSISVGTSLERANALIALNNAGKLDNDTFFALDIALRAEFE